MDPANSKYTMVCSNGLFMMGVLQGGNKLINPRVFSIVPDPDARPGERKELAQLVPLPSIPFIVNLSNASFFSYPVPEHDAELIKLYESVTSPEVMRNVTNHVARRPKPVEPVIKMDPRPSRKGKVIMES